MDVGAGERCYHIGDFVDDLVDGAIVGDFDTLVQTMWDQDSVRQAQSR
jgi:hypothetical protein